MGYREGASKPFHSTKETAMTNAPAIVTIEVHTKTFTYGEHNKYRYSIHTDHQRYMYRLIGNEWKMTAALGVADTICKKPFDLDTAFEVLAQHVDRLHNRDSITRFFWFV
jgi:predicted glycosyl hydrolase (DUF1957 family)